jgi:hypothetical protein
LQVSYVMRTALRTVMATSASPEKDSLTLTG